MTKNILIWWLDQEETKKVYKNKLLNLPTYIVEGIDSRFGRAGRGRLWVPKEIECETINWKDGTPICKLISLSSAGGIVFHSYDFDKVKHLPGFVTDINCTWIPPLRKAKELLK